MALLVSFKQGTLYPHFHKVGKRENRFLMYGDIEINLFVNAILKEKEQSFLEFYCFLKWTQKDHYQENNKLRSF